MVDAQHFAKQLALAGKLLITSDSGSAEHVYLTDFGLTRKRAVGETVEGAELVGQASGLPGTIDYAAPEQIEGKPADRHPTWRPRPTSDADALHPDPGRGEYIATGH